MNGIFQRVRSEQGPDLWPEIARRLEQLPPNKPPRRVWQVLSVAISIVLVAGALVWGISALRHGLSLSVRPISPGQVIRIPVGRYPQAIYADDTSAWVIAGTSETDNVLWRIDAGTDHAVELPDTRGAVWAAVGEGFAWVACTGPNHPCGDNSVLKLDHRTGATLATIDLPGKPYMIAAGLGSVWVSTDIGLVKIDAVTARIVATFSTRTGVLGTAGGSVWALNARPGHLGSVIKIDPIDGRIVDEVEVPDPCWLLTTEAGVWVTSCSTTPGSSGTTIERIDPATDRISYRAHVEEVAFWFVFAEGRLWFGQWVGDHAEIEARDAATGKLTGMVLTVKPGPHPWVSMGPPGPQGVIIAAGDRSLWLTQIDSNDVVRLGISNSSGGSVGS
jgi:hypothetical protein